MSIGGYLEAASLFIIQDRSENRGRISIDPFMPTCATVRMLPMIP
jgi:hypothetical protein